MSFVEHLLSSVSPTVLRRYGVERSPDVILITPRFPTSRHVVAMVHPSGAGKPTVVVKIPRRPRDNSGVSREAEMLRELVLAAPDLAETVPEVLGVVTEGEHLVLVESAVHGVPLDPAEVQRRSEAAIRAGVGFIGGLPVTRPAVTGPVDAWFDTVMETPLLRFQECLTETLPEVSSMVDRTLELLRPLAEAHLPRVIEHGDLSHPNLFLRDDGRLNVIDWERSTTEGLPGLDLVFYLQYVAESQQSAYEREQQRAVLRSTFLEPSGWGGPHLEAHLASRGVPESLASVVLLATWARSASTLVDRLLPGAAGVDLVAPSPEQVSATLLADRDVALWRETLEFLDR